MKKIKKSKKKSIVKKIKKIVVKKKTAKKPIKKPVKHKTTKAATTSAKLRRDKEKKIGKVTHYFDKIKVVVVKLSDTIGVGDTIRIKGGQETDFKQKIGSMEVNGEKIKKAKKGQQVGIKVKEKARDGYLVFKL